jgi:hypothetical protein
MVCLKKVYVPGTNTGHSIELFRPQFKAYGALEPMIHIGKRGMTTKQPKNGGMIVVAGRRWKNTPEITPRANCHLKFHTFDSHSSVA